MEFSGAVPSLKIIGVSYLTLKIFFCFLSSKCCDVYLKKKAGGKSQSYYRILMVSALEGTDSKSGSTGENKCRASLRVGLPCPETSSGSLVVWNVPETLGLVPDGSAGKESACSVGDTDFDTWVRKIPWRRKWQPTPVFLPGKSHVQRSLAGYSPRGCKESDMTEHRAHCSKVISSF